MNDYPEKVKEKTELYSQGYVRALLALCKQSRARFYPSGYWERKTLKNAVTGDGASNSLSAILNMLPACCIFTPKNRSF